MVTRVEQWLERIGLERYATAFAENDIDLDVLAELTDQDFQSLGVSIGHRRRLLKALASSAPEESVGGLEAATEEVQTEAEHRQLTVMFCDLAESTALSEKLDVEDYRELILKYQEACTREIERVGGFVARYLGDGILAYFGYPRAHEDDAERAVRAALAIRHVMRQLQEREGGAKGVDLGARIGICTGRVVVGDIVGTDAAQEKTVLGEIPNMAARLQGVAHPGDIVIGEGTLALIRGLFRIEHLGQRELKGISTPAAIHRVLGESENVSRFQANAARGLTSLIGRKAEIDLLLARWAQAVEGETQAVVVIAAAGMGKSRVTEALKEALAPSRPSRVLYFCSPYYQNSALHPALEQFRRALGISVDAAPEEALEKIKGLLDQLGYAEQGAVALLAEALSLPQSVYQPVDLARQQRKERLLNLWIDIIENITTKKPVLMIVEDWQWIDPTTSALLELLVERTRTARLLLVVTTRCPEGVAWQHLPNVTMLSLNHLGRKYATQMIREIARDRLPEPDVVEQILRRTDGVPLFLEELTRVVVGSLETDPEGAGTGMDGACVIPSSLQDSLTARLDSLGEARELVQIASVLGRTIRHDLLFHVAPYGETKLNRLLDRLLDEDVLQRRGQVPAAQYRFRQALIQDAAYQSLLRSSRQRHHRAVAVALLEHFRGFKETQPEIIAYHFTEAGMAREAIPFWHRAARKAFDSSANHEAIAHLRKGLELVDSLADSPERARQELELRLTLGGALGTVRGWASADVGGNYDRARQLCRLHGDETELFTVDWGLWLFHQQGGRMRQARELASRILELAERIPESGYALQAHHAAWTTAERSADFVQCSYHAEHGLRLYDPDVHRSHASAFGGHDPGVCAAVHLSSCQAEMGRVDQAVASIERAMQMAADISDPFSQALSRFYACKLYQTRGESAKCLAYADQVIEISTTSGFALLAAQGTTMRGWAIAAAGDLDSGIGILRDGYASVEATGSKVRKPYFMTLLAALLLDAGRLDEAISTIRIGREALDASGEITNEIDLIRVEGELRAAAGAADDGVRKLREALRLAGERSAKWPELRAATSLAKIRMECGDGAAAREILEPVYALIVEGLDTRDPLVARGLLEQLGR